ncbi:MAG TPA: alpha/beta hydrolase [Candidatus Saccharimonadales bacterium]|nr:alpha/beta hydrolase [Candidatus Saccharimonadales bacterium]
MQTVTSKDGTVIAYEKTGSGPVLILVGGAFQDHNGLAAHAALLAEKFTVFNYDRRGRGESGNNEPYAVEREIEDIAALIQAAGGEAYVFGGSSGAVLALDAAAANVGITKLALYEPPFVVDDSRPAAPEKFADKLREMIAEGRRGDAAEAFMVQGANMPAEVVAGMRKAPFWEPGVEAVAHTLVHDALIMEGTMTGRPLPDSRWKSVTIPTTVLAGGNSPDWMKAGSKALVKLLPAAQSELVEGQAHDVSAEALAPMLVACLQS